MIRLYELAGKYKSEINKEISSLEKQIKKLPAGKVSCAKSRNTSIWRITEHGDRRVIPKKEIPREGIPRALRMLYEARLADLSYMDNAITGFLTAYEKRPATVKSFLQKNEEIKASLSPYLSKEDEIVKEWLSRERRHNTFHPENLRYKTLRGDMVRSKSESMIADFYYTHKIPYIYDCELLLDNVLIYPDFQIMLPGTHEVVIHEHFGMLEDIQYRTDAMRKLELYMANAYYPNINLFLTTELQSRPFSTADMEALYNGFFER